MHLSLGLEDGQGGDRKWRPACHNGRKSDSWLIKGTNTSAFKGVARIYPSGYSLGFVLMQVWNVPGFHISSTEWPIQSLLEVVACWSNRKLEVLLEKHIRFLHRHAFNFLQQEYRVLCGLTHFQMMVSQRSSAEHPQPCTGGPGSV